MRGKAGAKGPGGPALAGHPAGRRRDYDLLRVLSMAGVVYLHTAAGTLHDSPGTPLWYWSNVLAALFTAAVPLFFMLSGALLLNAEKSADPVHVLRHRLPRILVPGLAWSLLVIGLVWRGQGGEAALGKLLALPYTTVLTPYWFLYALVPIYLLLPLLKRMADHLKSVHWNYMMGLWAVLTLGMHTLRFFIPEPWNGLVTENMTLGVSLLEGYLGYFFLGAYLERLKRVPSRWVLWAVALADWAVISVGTWWGMERSGYYGEQFLSYQGVFTMVLAAALFLLARSYLGRGGESGRGLKFLSGCSFGVYLAHPMAIKLMARLWLDGTGTPADTIPEQAAVWLLALAGCILGVALCASIPLVCYVVTGQRFSAASRESNLFALLGKKGRND